MKERHTPNNLRGLQALPSPVAAIDERRRSCGHKSGCIHRLSRSTRREQAGLPSCPGADWSTAGNFQVDGFKLCVDQDHAGFAANLSPDGCAMAATETELLKAIARKVDELIANRDDKSSR